MVRSLTIKNNDNTLVLYLCSIIRTIIALHNLINNKIHNREVEKGVQPENKDKEKEKEKTKEQDKIEAGDKTTEKKRKDNI